MEVILLKNTLYNGKRILAGEKVKLEESVAKQWVKAKLAQAVEKKGGK